MKQIQRPDEDVHEAVRGWLHDNFLRREQLRDDDDLLQVLNSLQLLRMVIELESRFQIAIDNSELTPENLGTIERIAAFVEARRVGAPR